MNIIVTENFYKQIVAEALMNLLEEGEKRKPQTGKCDLVGVREIRKNWSISWSGGHQSINMYCQSHKQQ
jgi:hypothetical protein